MLPYRTTRIEAVEAAQEFFVCPNPGVGARLNTRAMKMGGPSFSRRTNANCLRLVNTDRYVLQLFKAYSMRGVVQKRAQSVYGTKLRSSKRDRENAFKAEVACLIRGDIRCVISCRFFSLVHCRTSNNNNSMSLPWLLLLLFHLPSDNSRWIQPNLYST